MRHSTGKPTALEQRRFEGLLKIGCICCRMLKVNGRTAEIHHLLSGNKRKGHEFTIPLCRWHHRAMTILPKAQAQDEYGPSLADGSKPFHARWGSDSELLAKTNELLRTV